MNRLSIYNVEKVEITKINHFHKNDETEEFWARDIVITDENGVEIEITLFSGKNNPNKNKLKVKNIK